MMLGLAVLMWRTGGQFATNGDTTAQLQIAKSPFIFGMSLLCALSGLVHLALIVAPAPELADGEGVAL
jgi:hypothetical protein